MTKFIEPTEAQLDERTRHKLAWLTGVWETAQASPAPGAEPAPKPTYERARQMIDDEVSFARRHHNRNQAYRKVAGRHKTYSIMGQGR